MIIIKFTLVAFLITMTWFASTRVFPPAPVGGPYYYADAPGAWAIQPKNRLTPFQGVRSERAVAVDFDDRCLPLLARHLVKGKEQWRMVWLWDRAGRLRWRLWEDPQGRVLRRQELF
jgi:hypothetical protein